MNEKQLNGLERSKIENRTRRKIYQSKKNISQQNTEKNRIIKKKHVKTKNDRSQRNEESNGEMCQKHHEKEKSKKKKLNKDTAYLLILI